VVGVVARLVPQPPLLPTSAATQAKAREAGLGSGDLQGQQQQGQQQQQQLEKQPGQQRERQREQVARQQQSQKSAPIAAKGAGGGTGDVGKEVVLAGQGLLEQQLLGLRFKISPSSFFQTNTDQAAVLYRAVARAAGLQPGELLLDLYCGTGSIALLLARQCGQVLGYEANAAAIVDAQQNARHNGIVNATFVCTDLERGVPDPCACTDRVSAAKASNETPTTEGSRRKRSARQALPPPAPRSAAQMRVSAKLAAKVADSGEGRRDCASATSSATASSAAESEVQISLVAQQVWYQPSVVVINPARPGLSTAVRTYLLACGARRLVYISCNAATQARDLAELCGTTTRAGSDVTAGQSGGPRTASQPRADPRPAYRLSSVQVVDLFPHTDHVESICVLDRLPQWAFIRQCASSEAMTRSRWRDWSQLLHALEAAGGQGCAARRSQAVGVGWTCRWHPLKLCWSPDKAALPAKGKQDPELGYKRVRDQPLKAQHQQQQKPAAAQYRALVLPRSRSWSLHPLSSLGIWHTPLSAHPMLFAGAQVAAVFGPALAALLRRASVRVPLSPNRQKAALRRQNHAQHFRGVTRHRRTQSWEVGSGELTSPPYAPGAHIWHDRHQVYLGGFQLEEHAAKAHDLMAIKCRGINTTLNFSPETYSDMHELLALVDQPLLIELLRAFSRNNGKFLAETARNQQKTSQEAALKATAPVMSPDWSDASPTATTLLCQPGQILAPHSAAGRGMAMGNGAAKWSDEAHGWPVDGAVSEAARRQRGSTFSGKRHRSFGHGSDSASLGSDGQGTFAGRSSAADAYAEPMAGYTGSALEQSLLAASQLVGASVVGLGVFRGRARPAGRGPTEADAAWEEAEPVNEEGGGYGEAMLASGHCYTAEQDDGAQDYSQTGEHGRLILSVGNQGYASSLPLMPGRVQIEPDCSDLQRANSALFDTRPQRDQGGWDQHSLVDTMPGALPAGKGSEGLGADDRGEGSDGCTELTAPDPINGALRGVAMGHSSHGPALTGPRQRPPSQQVASGVVRRARSMYDMQYLQASRQSTADPSLAATRVHSATGMPLQQLRSSTGWGQRRTQSNVSGSALGGQFMEAVGEGDEGGDEQQPMEHLLRPPAIQTSKQPAVSSHKQRLQLLLRQQRCFSPIQDAATPASGRDDQEQQQGDWEQGSYRQHHPTSKLRQEQPDAAGAHSMWDQQPQAGQQEAQPHDRSGKDGNGWQGLQQHGQGEGAGYVDADEGVAQQSMRSLLPTRACSARPGLRIGWGSRPAGVSRSPAPRTCILPWLPIGPSRKLSVPAQGVRYTLLPATAASTHRYRYKPASQAKLALDELVAEMKDLPVQMSSSQGKQLAQLVQDMAHWDRLEESSRDKLTQALLRCLGVGDEAENAYQLRMAAWSLVMLERHLPPSAAPSAFSAFIRHCASSESMKRSRWHDWGQLLRALAYAGVQCSKFPDLTRLFDRAVQLLPRKLNRSLSYKDISMPLTAMVAVGYTGSAQPLLQAVTASISLGRVMQTARFRNWRKLIMAAAELHGCSMETRQLLAQFAAKAGGSLDALDAEDVSTLLNAMRLARWPNTEFVEQLAVRAAGHPRGEMDSSQLAIRLCSLAYLGNLNSSVRDLAAKVAEADLTAFGARDLTNLLYARSMFLAQSIQEAVFSGHSQLASEPQLDSMAAALWRECSRRESEGQQWGEQDLLQLHTARQIKDACTGGQTSLAASTPPPSLQQFVAKATSYRTSNPKLNRGIVIMQSPGFLHDGGMSAVVVHVKLQQLAHCDAGVVVNKAVFDQLASDSERAAFMRAQKCSLARTSLVLHVFVATCPRLRGTTRASDRLGFATGWSFAHSCTSPLHSTLATQRAVAEAQRACARCAVRPAAQACSLRNPPSQAKRALEVEVAEIQCLPVQLSSSQGEQLVQLVQEMANWDRLEASSRRQLTKALLQCLGVEDEAEDAYQLSMTAWSLVILKRHLPPPAAASAFSAFIRHCTSSEAMKKGSWRDWSQLLHALEAAGMQCSKCPELTRLCNRAVQLLPGKLIQSLSNKDISMPLSAMVALRYRGSAQPLLQAVTAAISQGLIMVTAGSKNNYWSELLVAAGELAGCVRETVQLLEQFAAKASDNMDYVDAEHVSTLLRVMRLVVWPRTGSVEKQGAGHQKGSSQLAISIWILAYLGCLDSSVRDLAAKVAKADLTAFGARDLIKLLDARSIFLALSIHQAVSSGHSQLASEPQLNSMAAALWRECSRREAVGLKWSLDDQKQLHIARQLKDACTGVQTSLTASPPSPSLQKFVAKKISGKVLWDIEGIDVEAEAWRRQLASDNELAAFTRDQVRASLPEAKAWQQVLQTASAVVAACPRLLGPTRASHRLGFATGWSFAHSCTSPLHCTLAAHRAVAQGGRSVRSLAAKVVEADSTALCTRDLTNLLHARSMFLALSIQQAVSSGHSQLASEPQLDSMAAALWRECSRRGPDNKKWRAEHFSQLYAASQRLGICTGGQTSLAESPALQEWVAKALTCQTSSTESVHTANGCVDHSQLVQALAAAGYNEVEQAAVSLDGTVCTQLVVKGPGLTRGIAVYQSHEFLPDGSMSGAVAHVKLQQLAHFDAGVVMNKADFDQLVSDSERAAFMREQVQASLPEAEAWRQLLQAASVWRAAVSQHHGSCCTHLLTTGPGPHWGIAVDQHVMHDSLHDGNMSGPRAEVPGVPRACALTPGYPLAKVPGECSLARSSLVLHAFVATCPRLLGTTRASDRLGFATGWSLAHSCTSPLHSTLAAQRAVAEAQRACARCAVRPAAPACCLHTPLPLDTLRKPKPPSSSKLDFEVEVADLPVQMSSSQGKQLVQVVQDMADWDRLEESSRRQLTKALLQCLGVGGQAEGAYQLSITAWSLVILKRHLPPPAATSAFSAFIRHCASSKAMKRSRWHDWGQLLHALGAAGMQCSDCPALTRLCDQAVQLLPSKLIRGMSYNDISMPFSAMVSVGYRGSAQPLLQAVTAAISQGLIMKTARFKNWRKLTRAARELPSCSMETRQLLEQFAARWTGCTDDLDAEDVSTLLYAMCLVWWQRAEFPEFTKKLAELAAGPLRGAMGCSQLAISLCCLACIGYLDSSVRSLAAKVAEEDLTALGARDLTALLYARSLFLSLSIRQAVSSGHSRLASEPQLNSMAAALWREYSRREAVGQQWSEQELLQLHTARQTKDACTGGQTSLATLPLPTTWLPSGSSWELSEPVQAHCEFGPSPPAKLDLEQLVAVVEDLPVELSGSQGEQLVQVVQDMADWDRLEESSRDKLTEALLQCLGVGGETEDAYQLSMAALSLVKLKRRLPPSAATSAFSALLCHCASSEAFKRGSWRDWSKLLHVSCTAGMQCSSSPDLTWLCDQAVQLLPEKLTPGITDKYITRPIKAMATVGYRGSAQPLLQAVTAAISQETSMVDAGFPIWRKLIKAAAELPGCRIETRQLLAQFAAKAPSNMEKLIAQDASTILNAMRLVQWPDIDLCRQLAKQVRTDSSQLASSICSLACLGYLDSSVRDLAAKVAEADLTALCTRDLTNLLHARSMFLALSIHQAVSSGHSQLATMVQLGVTSQQVQALPGAGHRQVLQAKVSQHDGSCCTHLLNTGPGPHRGIAVDQRVMHDSLQDGSMSGVVAHVKLQQLAHFDAGVVIKPSCLRLRRGGSRCCLPAFARPDPGFASAGVRDQLVPRAVLHLTSPIYLGCPAGRRGSSACLRKVCGEPQQVDQLLSCEVDAGMLQQEEAEQMPSQTSGPPAQVTPCPLLHAALCTSEPPPQVKLDLELVAVVEKLPAQVDGSQGEQLVQLIQDMTNWDRLEESERDKLTQALLHCLGVRGEGEKVYRLYTAVWSLTMLKRHLPPSAATFAFSALVHHSVSSEALKRGSWRGWSKLLHALGAAGLQCSDCPDLTRLCDQAVQLLPGKLSPGLEAKYIRMPLRAMVSVGYRGSAQPLLQAVTAAINQETSMVDAGFEAWGSLIRAARGLTGCCMETSQLLECFAAKVSGSMDALNVQHVSIVLNAMCLAWWPDTELCRQLAERAPGHLRGKRGRRQLAISLYSLACLGYLDSSVRDLAAKVVEAKLAAFKPLELTNLLHARSTFLALSIQQAVSSGHSQLASEPQLNSMAAALWRECSRRGPDDKKWRAKDFKQLYAASQWLQVCTGGQTSLAESPALLELVAKAITCQTSTIESAQTADGCVDHSQLVRALAAAGYNEVEQGAVSLDGTNCEVVVKGPGLTRGIAVYQSHEFLPDGSMSGVVAHVKLQQLAQFDAGVVVNKAVFDQLASDSERAAFMREQVRASLPEAEAWLQVLQMLKEASSLLPARVCSARPGLRVGWGSRPAGSSRSSAPYISILPWLPSVPSRKLSVPAQGVRYNLLPPTAASQVPQGLFGKMYRDPGAETLPRPYQGFTLAGEGEETPSMFTPAKALPKSEPSSQAKLDLEQQVAEMKHLPVQLSSSQGKQLVQVVQYMADWDRLEARSRAQLTEALLQCLGVGNEPETANQLSMAALSLAMLKRHLPPPAATSAFSAFIRHCASSKAMKRGGWRFWSKLLDTLGTAGLQCSDCPGLTRLCDQAVQLLPREPWRPRDSHMSRQLIAMATVGYRGSAQPLLQAVTTAFSQGRTMNTARFRHFGELIRAATELSSCRTETRQLLEKFAAKASGSNSMDHLDAEDVSTFLNVMRLMMWPITEFIKQLVAGSSRGEMDGRQLAISLYSLACLGYLDSSVRGLAAKVAEADLTAFCTRDLTNLLHAQSMFLALSIHQAVSSGHSQLASEPQLNSMAAALWRECSRRGPGHKKWGAKHFSQLYAASQWLGVCTGGQTSLTESPALQGFVAKAITCQTSTIESAQTADGCHDHSQLVQALAAAGYNEVEKGAVSQDGTVCSQLVVKGPGLTRGIAVYQSHEFLPDGSMSGVVAHVKLQQLTHFDAGVVVNKAVFDQLASDSERAAFMRDQSHPSMQSLLPARACSAQPGLRIGWGSRPAGVSRSPAPRTCSLTCLPVGPSRKLSVHAQGVRYTQSKPSSQAKLDLEQQVAEIKFLPLQISNRQGKQLVHLALDMAEWDRLEASSRRQLTGALLQCLGVGDEAENAHQLSIAALSLVMLKRHLPPPAATSAFTVFIRYCDSSEAMKKGSWRDWGQLLHALGAAGMQCSDCPALTSLCDLAVRVLPKKPIRTLSYKDINMPLSAMVTVGYTGSAQPILQAVTAAISRGRIMKTARFTNWRKLIMAAGELHGCSLETRQLLAQFAARVSDSLDEIDAEDVSTLLNATRLALWPETEFVKQLAVRAAGHSRGEMDSSQLAIRLCSLTFLGYLDSSVRSLATKVAEADLTAFCTRDLTNLLHARSIFLALSIQQAVSSGHSQPATLRQYNPAPRPKQDLEQLVSAVEELPFLSSSSQVKETSQLLWCFADWARQPENSRTHMTLAQHNAVMALLQRMAGGAGDSKAVSPPTPSPLQQFDARQLNMAAWSLGKLKPHLPAAAATLACTAIASHSASSEAMRSAGWRDWSNLLHGLATAGMKCSDSSDLTWLCDQAVQLLPEKLAWGAASQAISMTLWAMAKSGYTGSAQPLLQSVTAAISQGEVTRDAEPGQWASLIWAASKLPGCREGARQLLDQFAARAKSVVPGLRTQEACTIMYAMSLVLWHDKEVCMLLAERAAQVQQVMNGQDRTNSLYGLARLGYLDYSVRSLAAGVAKADLAAFTTQHLTNLLYARSMLLALSIHEAVSSGHSQLASEPQLNSMAAAVWRECSRRESVGQQWGEQDLLQLYTASQWLHICTGGQTSLAASPALQELVLKAAAFHKSTLGRFQTACRQIDCGQLVQALTGAGHSETQQAALSQDGTHCALLLVHQPGVKQGIAVEHNSNYLHDGSMSGVVAHVKLQQLAHFDATAVVNKAVFDQLASDSEQAAFMREEVRASLPEAEAWRQLLQTEGEHLAGQVKAPAAATPAAQQQQAVIVSAGQQARQQGALPLPGNCLTQLPPHLLSKLPALEACWLEGNPGLGREAVRQLLQELPHPARLRAVGLDTQQLLPLSGSQELRQAGPRLKVGEVLPPLPGGSSVGYWKLVPSPNTLVLDSVTGRLLTDGQGRLERQGVLVVALGSAPGTPNWGGLLGRVYKQGLTPAERAFDVLYLVDPSRSWYGAAREEQQGGPAGASQEGGEGVGDVSTGGRRGWGEGEGEGEGEGLGPLPGGEAVIGLGQWREGVGRLARQYRHVLLLGDSMGATAGLLLAPLAHSVLAFTPQVDLASSCMRPGASSTALAGLRAQVEAAVETAARQGCRISVLVGTWQHDLDQANLLAPDQVRHKVFGLDSHRLALHLDSKGELLPLVRVSGRTSLCLSQHHQKRLQ
ncbi:hypothetical protein QJQ45_014706, partial [Haematococcus lacustris]